MADDQDFCLPGRRVPPRQPQPGEPLWQISVNNVTWSCELRTHGEWAVEAQILCDGECVIGQRFETRTLAERWSKMYRQEIERGLHE